MAIFLAHCGSWILIERVPNILPQILHCIVGGPKGVEGVDGGEVCVGVIGASALVGDFGYKKTKHSSYQVNTKSGF